MLLCFHQVSTQSKMVWGLHKDSGSTLFKISAHNDAITGIVVVSVVQCTVSVCTCAQSSVNTSVCYQVTAFPPLDIALSCNVPGLLVTAGADDTVKFWDILVQSSCFSQVYNNVRELLVYCPFRKTSQYFCSAKMFIW